ncbi:hypothetical protein SAV31267_083510 [Streptomyces avermitilis]|uniref:HTH tetR-type domain-containing protein n=1 Tax=Streptomyces avermitilis TaxID=33903 RepID=A0A4D4N4P1_STRAX|nr:hypothetical protein SAV31267_083510 [Streptomyces avermitilis]
MYGTHHRDAVESATVGKTNGRRERLRAETTAEIKRVALELMATGGPDAITLRAIAREMGMTANAIYGYFATRDDLVTTLINDVYTSLVDTVDTAWETAPAQDPAARIQAWACAFRGWALAGPEGFRLIYGDPVPGYRPPAGAPPRTPPTASARASPHWRPQPGRTPNTATRTATSPGPTSTPASWTRSARPSRNCLRRRWPSRCASGATCTA